MKINSLYQLILIIILSIIVFILPNVSFAQIKPPETPEEIMNFLFRLINPILGGIEKAWQEALGIWQKMINFFENIWSVEVKPSFQNIWERIFALFEKG